MAPPGPSPPPTSSHPTPQIPSALPTSPSLTTTSANTPQTHPLPPPAQTSAQPPHSPTTSSHPSHSTSSPINPSLPPPPSNAAIEEIIARAQALAGSGPGSLTHSSGSASGSGPGSVVGGGGGSGHGHGPPHGYPGGVPPQLQGPSAHSLKHKGSYGSGFGGFVTGFHPAAVGADGRVNLFVGNLPFRVRWQDVKDLFRRAGTVLRADVSLDPQTNRSRGYGSVLMGSREDGVKAIEMFNGYTWQTRILEVRPDRLPPEYEPQPYIPPSSTLHHVYGPGGHPPGPHPGFGGPDFMHHGGPGGPGNQLPAPESMPGGAWPAGPGSLISSPPHAHVSPQLSMAVSGGSSDRVAATPPFPGAEIASPIPGKAVPGPDRGMSRSPFGPGLLGLGEEGQPGARTTGPTPFGPHDPSLGGGDGRRASLAVLEHKGPLDGSPSAAHSRFHTSGGIPPQRGPYGMSPPQGNEHGMMGRRSPAPGGMESMGGGSRRGSVAPGEGSGMGGRPGDIANRMLHVSNIPFQMQWQDLKDLFRTCGNVVRADVAIGPDNRSKGFGTVLLATEADAMNALRRLDGYEHNGRILRVRPDRPQQQHNSYGHGGGPHGMMPPNGRGTPSQGGYGGPSGYAGGHGMQPNRYSHQGPGNYQSMGMGGMQSGMAMGMAQPYGLGFGGQSGGYISLDSDAFATDSRKTSLAERVASLTDEDGGEGGMSAPGSEGGSVAGGGPSRNGSIAGPIGPNRPSPLRQGVPHPGRIVMPSYPNFGGTNPMSPLQTRGLPPMTPSMPGFTFHAYPATPPLHPLSFLSPGLGPFSPTLPTGPGSPGLAYPPGQGGFNPFMNAAPGAPVGMGGDGTPMGHPAQGQGRGEPEYFPPVDRMDGYIGAMGMDYGGGYEAYHQQQQQLQSMQQLSEGMPTQAPSHGEDEATTPVGAATGSGANEVDPFAVVNPPKAYATAAAAALALDKKKADPMDSLAGKVDAMAIQAASSTAAGANGATSAVGAAAPASNGHGKEGSGSRDSRASFNDATRPEGLAAGIMAGNSAVDRRASMDELKS